MHTHHVAQPGLGVVGRNKDQVNPWPPGESESRWNWKSPLMKFLVIVVTRYQAQCQAVEQWILRLRNQLSEFKSQLIYLGAV